jgi:hypothetical protein
VSDNIIEFPTTWPVAPPSPDDWRLIVALDALFAIFSDADSLEHARQLAGEALVVAGGGDAA